MYIDLNMMSKYEYEYDVPNSSLLNLHSGLFIYKHVIGHAGLISSRTSVKAMYGVCILLLGYGGFSQKDIEL